jgi:hypothetical protein
MIPPARVQYSYELKMLNLYLLMYADDTVLFSENVHELQNMINVVNVCSNEYNLHVNLLKTKQHTLVSTD